MLPGDATGQARGINARGQVVGISSRPGSNRAFLWQNGVIMALDSLVGPGFPEQLISAQDINDAGVITGTLFEPSTGRSLAFVATPTKR